MQGPIEESQLHRQASDSILNKKIIDSHEPDLSRELSIDLPAYYGLDEKYTTSSSEIWSYYLYLVGNSGATPLYFAPIAFQSLLAQAAGSAGVLRFAGRVRTVNSIVLFSNGIAFAIQTVLFSLLGSCADFGNWRPNILIVVTLLNIAVGFSWLSVYTPGKWMSAAVLYILETMSFQICWTFWTAAFPGLARSTRTLREAAAAFKSGTLSRTDFEFADSMKRNEISNMSNSIGIGGSTIIVAIGIGIFKVMHINSSMQNNSRGLSAFIAFGATVELALALPWFVLEKRRPGLPRPENTNIVQAGLWQVYQTGKDIWKLKQSLIYLIIYFLLGDALNTTVTIVTTLQIEVQAFDSLTLNYLYLLSIVSQALGIYIYWFVQRKYNIRTKTMLNIVSVAIVLMAMYGFAGIWTQVIGFHNRWEFWFFNAYFGFFVCPWYSYSQTMISEVTPHGKEFLFFSFFGVIGKTSSFLGPFISSAIIDHSSGRYPTSSTFYFLMPLCLVSTIALMVGVDVQKSKREQDKFLAEEQVTKERIEEKANSPERARAVFALRP